MEYEQITITVRGEKKTYHVASETVEIDGIGPNKIVASKTADGTTRYYLSTDLGRWPTEILDLVGDCWNIETVHQESDAKFGFKQYEVSTSRLLSATSTSYFWRGC